MRPKRTSLILISIALLSALVLGGVPSTASAADPATGAALTLYGTDTSAFPTVVAKVAVPAELMGDAGTIPEFAVLENGDSATVLSAKPEVETRKVQVALLIDTSGSMKGQPLAYAKDAAKRFLSAMAGKAEVAIVSFSSSAVVVSGYSADTAALSAAIDSLQAGGETAVYDAVVEGTKIASDPEATKAFILLSDGGDTTSVTALDQAIKAAQGAAVPVLAVALESPEFNQQSLQLIAEQSGGRLMTVSDVEQLPTYFEQIAKEITSVYEVTYRSDKPATKNIDLDVSAKTSKGTATITTTIDNPIYVQTVNVGKSVYKAPTTNPWMLVLAIVLAFVSVALLAAAVIATVSGRKAKALDQMRYYDQLKGDYSQAADPNSGEGIRNKIVDAVGAVAGKRGFTQVIGRKLEKAGMPIRPAEWIAGHLTLVVVAAFLTQLLTGRLAISLIVVLLASLVPLMLIDNRGTKRVQTFESQLPDVLGLIASGLRTGWGLQQALGLVVSEGAQPSAEEFRRVQVEARLGVPVEQAMESMADRLGSEMFRWVVQAVAIQREVGGNLAQVLDNVSTSVRDRDALHRQVQALTAEGRFSAVVLSVLPFVVAVALLVVSPDYLLTALRTPFGLPLIILGVVLLVVGILWLRSVSKIEY